VVWGRKKSVKNDRKPALQFFWKRFSIPALDATFPRSYPGPGESVTANSIQGAGSYSSAFLSDAEEYEIYQGKPIFSESLVELEK
jgi:hypothetical protein